MPVDCTESNRTPVFAWDLDVEGRREQKREAGGHRSGIGLSPTSPIKLAWAVSLVCEAGPART